WSSCSWSSRSFSVEFVPEAGRSRLRISILPGLRPELTMQTTLRLALLLLAVTATPAVAQDGGLMDINTGLMVWTVLIFVLVLGILYKAAFPHILGAVEAREARIRQLIEEAAQDRERARIALEEQTRQLQETRA